MNRWFLLSLWVGLLVASPAFCMGCGFQPAPIPPNNSVTTPKIADGSVTTPKVADGAITNQQVYATAAIADTKLATISTPGKVADSALSANVPVMTAGALPAVSGANLTNLPRGNVTAAGTFATGNVIIGNDGASIADSGKAGSLLISALSYDNDTHTLSITINSVTYTIVCTGP